MRVVREFVGHIDRDGQRLHSNVRGLVDDQGRVGVFTGRAAPEVVYSTDVVTYEVVRKPCSCKGDIPLSTLKRLWEASERVTV